MVNLPIGRAEVSSLKRAGGGDRGELEAWASTWENAAGSAASTGRADFFGKTIDRS
jgi:hypothetical protein